MHLHIATNNILDKVKKFWDARSYNDVFTSGQSQNGPASPPPPSGKIGLRIGSEFYFKRHVETDFNHGKYF